MEMCLGFRHICLGEDALPSTVASSQNDDHAHGSTTKGVLYAVACGRQVGADGCEISARFTLVLRETARVLYEAVVLQTGTASGITTKKRRDLLEAVL